MTVEATIMPMPGGPFRALAGRPIAAGLRWTLKGYPQRCTKQRIVGAPIWRPRGNMTGCSGIYRKFPLVDDLRYLQACGRVWPTLAVLGGVFWMKSAGITWDGGGAAVERIRSRRRASGGLRNW